MASTERQKFEYENESELLEDYKKIVLASPQSLSYAAEYIFETLVEEAVEGAAFQTHFENKHPVRLTKIFIQGFGWVAKVKFVTYSDVYILGSLRTHYTAP